MTTTQLPTATALLRSVTTEQHGDRHSTDQPACIPTAADVRALHRALLHSNRKQMTAGERRSLIDNLLPVLGLASDSLQERCQAQALPFSGDTEASARLLHNLQHEQTRALELLLQTEPSVHLADIERSLELLAQQAETAVNAFKALPDGLLQSAHHLYRQLEPELPNAVGAMPHPQHSAARSASLYRYLLLISLTDVHTLRITQLPALLAFLFDTALLLRIQPLPAQPPHALTDFGFDLDQDAPPVRFSRLLAHPDQNLRHLDISRLLEHIDGQLDLYNSHRSSSGLENLQRSSLLRLRSSLVRDTGRRLPRRQARRQQELQFGFRAVCLGLTSTSRDGEDTDASDDEWALANENDLGCELVSAKCTVGRVQVGELVNLLEADRPAATSNSGRVKVRLGVVRWLCNIGSGRLHIGVEFLGNSLLPVRVARLDADADEPSESGPRTSLDAVEPVRQESFIMTCKVAGKTRQTLMLPVCHEFCDGELLQLSLGGQSRKVRLQTCLQNNGLFSQFAIVDP